jgi:hypothetical protein
MNTKICKKCGEEKAATSEFFHKQKRVKCGLFAVCKSCRKIYFQQNKEKISKREKQYREINKEKILERKKQYYEANKERSLEYREQYYEANKDKILKQQKQYREVNKEKMAEYNRQYQQKNKHLTRQSTAKRRAQKLKQTPDYANLDLIKLIYENCPKGYQVDHMDPTSNGGLHHESNLCYLPSSMNIAKGAKSIEEFGLDTFNKNVIYWQDHLKKEG